MEPPSRGNVSVLNESGRSVPVPAIEHAVRTALSMHGFPAAEVAVLLTDDEHVRTLNRNYRALDEATDVLTFVADDQANGDIAISVPYAERQAAVRGVSLDQELGFLAIHGALHLVGFDDETEVERAEMVDEMNRAALAVGLLPDAEWASLLHGVSA